MNKEKKNIFLIGFMGAGKSTIARAIKQKLGYPVVEMDERIVKEQGMPISKIFETYGELYFRELETKLIQSLNQQEPTIVSCGGGVAMRQENVDCMRDGGSGTCGIHGHCSGSSCCRSKYLRQSDFETVEKGGIGYGILCRHFPVQAG